MTKHTIAALILALLIPATAGAQGAYGPGGCLTETTRTCEATDSTIAIDLDAIADTVGFDGEEGPVLVQSVGGTQATGEIEELRVDGNGELQVDVLTLPALTGPIDVQGIDAEGAALTADPVLIGGSTGIVIHALAVDAAGTLDTNTELPAAAVLGDATANPTAPAVGSFLMGWDNGGGVWGRVRQNAGRLEVDLDLVGGSQLSIGQQVMASSIPVVIASDQSPVSTNTTQVGSVAVTTDQGVATPGTQRVKEAQPDGQDDGIFNVDQAGADSYAIADDAYQTTCQNQSILTHYIRVRADVAAGAATPGGILAPEAGGAGGTYTTELTGVTLYFYNLTAAVNSPVSCFSDTEN